MKWLFLFGFFLLVGNANGQTVFLKEAVVKLDRALIKKDTIVLKQLLHKDLSYGHSNGWIESKEDVIKDLVSGKLSYEKIETKDHVWEAGKEWATVRSTMELKYKMDGKEGELRLHVLQVWLKTNKGWQLLARQSTKLG